MSHNRKIFVGMIFGRLTVLAYISGTGSGHGKVTCVCECGVTKNIPPANLLRGLTKSCGCLRRELSSRKARTHGACAVKGYTPEYRLWCHILHRCLKPNDTRYKDYGGRGITVCERWRYSFAEFLKDVGLRPTPKHSLDRINNDGNYEPGNVRWATGDQQLRNTRKNVNLEFNGQKMCLLDWAKHTGLLRETLQMRLRAGWSVSRALTTPARPHKTYKYVGTTTKKEK